MTKKFTTCKTYTMLILRRMTIPKKFKVITEKQSVASYIMFIIKKCKTSGLLKKIMGKNINRLKQLIITQ